MTEKIISTPNKKGYKKEVVSPYKVSLLLLIQEYAVAITKTKDGMVTDSEITFTEPEERELMFLLLQLLQSSDMDIIEFVKTLQNAIGKKFVNTVIKRLDDLYRNGIRAIGDLFQSLNEILFNDSKPLITKNSVLGLFVRRMILSYYKLAFSQLCSLQSKYHKLYEDYLMSQGENENVWIMSENSAAEDASISLIDMMDDNKDKDESPSSDADTISSNLYSQKQAEFFIAQQARYLLYNELAALGPKELQLKINKMLSNNPTLAEAHYLSYLNNLRIGEYCTAVDSLFHYFDRYALTLNESTSGKNTPQEESSKGYRYASLNLAALQYRFGHREEAMLAVKEAIQSAQEANDNVCLQHALGWLQRLTIENSGKSAYMLDRLVTKTSELNLVYLMSLGVQSINKYYAHTTHKPASIFGFLLKSDIINCQSSMSDVMCTSSAHKTSLWHLYGNSVMQSLNIQILLNSNTLHHGVYHNGEPECLGLCYLAQIYAGQGYESCAFTILESAKERLPSHSQYRPMIDFFEHQLQFMRSFYQGDYYACESLVEKISSYDALEAKLFEAVMLKEKGELVKCHKIVRSLLDLCESDTEKKKHDSQFLCRLLLLKGELLCCCGNATDAIEPLLKCITITKEYHYKYIHSLSTVQLAFVQFTLGMVNEAHSLVQTSRLCILTHGNLFDKARTQYLWVRCCIAAASKESHERKIQALNNCVKDMNDILSWFKKIKANYKIKDVIYFLARIYDELGHSSDRNQCALEFKSLDQQYPTWHKSLLLSL